MAGVQIQQFVGQVQGGQNVMGALSAQATDRFCTWRPLIGAVVGLSAAFAGPFISAFLVRHKALRNFPKNPRTNRRS